MEKEVVYTCNGILFSHKKECNLVVCDNMDGPRSYHTKLKVRQRIQQNTNRIKDTENKQWLAEEMW